jgi:hypothetical protein
MNDLKKQIIESLIRNYGTNNFRDSKMQAEIIRLYKYSGDQESLDYARNLIVLMRKNWQITITLWQSEWQSRSKNKFHDSFELREKYITSHVNDENKFIHQAREYNKIRRPDLFVWKYGIRE